MRTIWVTGVSGSGTSALSRRLAARGHDAVSADSADSVCRWVDAAAGGASRPP